MGISGISGNIRAFLLLFLLFLGMVSVSFAHEIITSDGIRYQGTILMEDDKYVVMEIDSLVQIISKRIINSIDRKPGADTSGSRTFVEARLLLADSTELEGKVLTEQDGKVAVRYTEKEDTALVRRDRILQWEDVSRITYLMRNLEVSACVR